MCSFINTALENLHLYQHLLEIPTLTIIMPCHQQRNTQSDEEHSTHLNPSSLNHEHHGRIEAWFEGNEENIQVFLIKMTRKKINIPKVLMYS